MLEAGVSSQPHPCTLTRQCNTKGCGRLHVASGASALRGKHSIPQHTASPGGGSVFQSARASEYRMLV